MKRVVLPLIVAALVLATSAAASPSAGAVRGVVVGKQHGRLLVASPRGLVRTVSGRASIGSRVLVRSGWIVGRAGRAHTARIRGVVVRRSGKLTFLSAGRHLLVVHSAGRRLSSVQSAAPAPGTVVQQTVSFDKQGTLDGQGQQQLGQSSQVQIQATVQAIGTGTVTLVITDSNNQQQTLTIPLPAGLTLPNSLLNSQVTLNVSFADGQPTANEQGDTNQQASDEPSDSQNGQQGNNEQSDSQDTEQGSQTTTTDQQTTTTDQQTTTTDQQTTRSSQDGGSGSSGD